MVLNLHVSWDEIAAAGRGPELPSESLSEVPLAARSVAGLSQREQARYRRACALLRWGGGARSLAANDVALAGLGVYEALLARSWAVRFGNPQEMTDLAEAALAVALALDCRGYGKRRVADLQARAWGELANAHRVADRLRSAQRAFGQAFALLQNGSGDLYLKARLFDLEASLLGTLGEFPLALGRLAALADLYRELGEPHLAGRTFLTRALYTHYSGEAGQAVRLNAEGMELIDRQRDPELWLHALHNHLLFLVELGLHRRAKRALFEHRGNLVAKDLVGALRLRALEGRISYGLGELVSAELAFGEAKQGLARAGLAFQGALGGLELAMVLVRQGRVEEAEREVIAAREVFLAQELYREHVGLMLFLEESLRRRRATAELIEHTVAYLRRKELEVGPRLWR
jgi:hypothetical protein